MMKKERIAIVEFRGKIYAGYGYEDTKSFDILAVSQKHPTPILNNVWHFQEINGLGHFRATKDDKGFWDNYEYDNEAVFGIEIEDKDKELYRILHR